MIVAAAGRSVSEGRAVFLLGNFGNFFRDDDSFGADAGWVDSAFEVICFDDVTGEVLVEISGGVD